MATMCYGSSVRPGRKVLVVTLTTGEKKIWSGNIRQPHKHLRHVLAAMRPGDESSAAIEYSFSYHSVTSSVAGIITLRANNAQIFIGREEHLPRRLNHLKDMVRSFIADSRNNLRSR